MTNSLLTPEQLRLICNQHSKKAILEAACISERLLDYMLRGERSISLRTEKLIRRAFPG